MAAISVRDLDEGVARRLKVRAAQHGRSMEAEVRAILTDAVSTAEGRRLNIAQAIQESSAEIGGVELEVPPRADMPQAADLPNELHAELARRAAERGMNLRAYLREVLAEHVAVPSMDEWLQRVRALGPANSSGPTGAEVVAAARAEDDGLVGR